MKQVFAYVVMLLVASFASCASMGGLGDEDEFGGSTTKLDFEYVLPEGAAPPQSWVIDIFAWPKEQWDDLVSDANQANDPSDARVVALVKALDKRAAAQWTSARSTQVVPLTTLRLFHRFRGHFEVTKVLTNSNAEEHVRIDLTNAAH